MLRIHHHFVCKDEARILPYFFKHYDQYVEKYFAYYNIHSTDNTLAILQSNPKVTIINKTDTFLDDRANLEVKNTEWKNYSTINNCDWVIITDTDEFLYHPQLLNILAEYKNSGVTLPSTKGYQMYSKSYPTFTVAPSAQIYDIIKMGAPRNAYSKYVVMSPEISPNYGVGAHLCTPTGPIKQVANVELKVLHYKIINGKEDFANKIRATNASIPMGDNKAKFMADTEDYIKYELRFLNNLQKVI